MKFNKNIFNMNEIWGGLAAMLVALPQSIAFGILVFSGMGAGLVSEGAVAGAVGAAVIGLTAPLFGGTPRLISSPCAPAAAFLAGLISEGWVKKYIASDPSMAIPVISLVGLLAGVSQIVFSFLGGGKVIKFIPYPVISGYMSSVGIIIILGQLPRILGVTGTPELLEIVTNPELWNHQAIIIGILSMASMYISPAITKKVPAPITGLTGGIFAYLILSFFYPENLELSGNTLVVGTLQGKLTPEYFVQRFSSISSFNANVLQGSLVAGITLAVILSIDTLKTGVIVDTISHNRSNSSKELIGQGIGNIASAVSGGIAGAGTLGATLVNISSGGNSKASGIYAGLFSLLAFLALTPLLAWIPVASLAGILIFVALRTIDWKMFSLPFRKSTFMDFIVITAVIAAALTKSLTAAAGAGFALSSLFFLRDQIRGSVIRRKSYGGEIFSRKSRLPEELAVLQQENRRTAVYELQGNLFFGNTDQILSSIYAEPGSVQYIIISLRRVHTFDSTAVHLFEQIDSLMNDRKGKMILAHLPEKTAEGKNSVEYLREIALVRTNNPFFMFRDMHDALEWAEEAILKEKGNPKDDSSEPLDLSQMSLLKDLNKEQIDHLLTAMEERHFSRKETVFTAGQTGDEVFFIRKGIIKIMLKMGGGNFRHLASFGRGDFFGDMSFMDHKKRSAEAVAENDVILYALSRSRFDEIAKEDPALGKDFYRNMARVLALRFRSIHTELRSLD